jgi:hypothetical protein
MLNFLYYVRVDELHYYLVQRFSDISKRRTENDDSDEVEDVQSNATYRSSKDKVDECT